MITFFKSEQEIKNSLKNNQALLLDFDNTLLDPVPARTYGLKKVFLEAGIPEKELEIALQDYNKINNYYWKAVEQNTVTTYDMQFKRFEDFSKQHPVNYSPEKMNKTYLSYFTESTTIEQKVMDALKELKDLGTKLIVVTNGFHDVQETRMKSSGLLNLLDSYFTSESVGAPKPNPKMFLDAKNYLEIIKCQTNDLWVVGDTYNADIKGAINAGLLSCWINNNYSENETQFDENNQSPSLISKDFLEFADLYKKAKIQK